MSDFITRPATAEDLPAVLGVQYRAFGRVAEEYGLEPQSLPPLRESCQDLRAQHSGGTRFFVAESASGEVIGSVRADVRGETVSVGRLVVDDGWTRMGVASALMDRLEASFPEAVRFELFTGADAAVAMHFYAKRGYREFRREDVGDYVLAWLEKRGAAAVS